MQGGCDTGEIELHRGWLSPDSPPVAVGTDECRRSLWVVDEQASFYEVPADPLAANPFQHLRLAAPRSLEVDSSELPLFEGVLLVSDDALLLGSGRQLRAFDRDGALLDRWELPAIITDATISGELPWIATDDGLWVAGTSIPCAGGVAAVVPDGHGGVWATLPGSDLLVRHDETLALVDSEPIKGLLGALTRDATTGRLYVATTAGVDVFETLEGSIDKEPVLHDTSPARALHSTSSHEILLLQNDTVEVFSDELALVAPEPLSLFIVVLLERPNTGTAEYECSSERGGESVETYVPRALSCLPFLESLPACYALGIIPQFLADLETCGLLDDLSPFWESGSMEPGILFHAESSTCGTDQDCHRGFLERERDTFLARVPTPTWISGLAPQADAGAEWPALVKDLGLSDLPYLHLGMDLDPGVSHEDPRAKDYYPPYASLMTEAWLFSETGDTFPSDASDGTIAVYPGDDTPGYNHGGCPNLFLNECHRVVAGGGVTFDAKDIEALDVLLHRALARRGAEGPNTWDFYFPDPGQFEYLVGCELVDGTWTGEDCQLAYLQAWIETVHRTFVLNGLAAWKLPSELKRP